MIAATIINDLWIHLAISKENLAILANNTISCFSHYSIIVLLTTEKYYMQVCNTSAHDQIIPPPEGAITWVLVALPVCIFTSCL